jgi:hypothetical protein
VAIASSGCWEMFIWLLLDVEDMADSVEVKGLIILDPVISIEQGTLQLIGINSLFIVSTDS